MTSDLDPPAAPDAASRRHLAAACAIDRIPPELVTVILEFLDVDSLRRAASVSRIFNLCAWSAGLYLSGQIVCNPFGDCESGAALLADMVQHALVNGRRLSLSLEFIVYDRPPGPHVQRILSLVSTSLHALVYLAIRVGPRLLPTLLAALGHPVPELRELNIHLVSDYGPPAFEAPVDLFGGAAPKLRDLVLHGLSLGPCPVPAFSHIDSVHLYYDYVFPSINYVLHFPNMHTLRLSYFAGSGAPAPAAFDLAGLRLRKLTISDAEHCPLVPAIRRWIAFAQLPAFEHICTRLHHEDPLWDDEDVGAVSIRLDIDSEDSSVRMHIIPGDRSWRRTYNVKAWNPNAPSPIRELTRLQLGRCLTYLRTDNEHLTALLEANWPTQDALRDMRIDFRLYGKRATMVWPPDWSHTMRRTPCAFGQDDVSAPAFAGDSYRYLRCTALETLALCCGPTDAAMAIESREVAFLGRALGQSVRPAQERAALILVGIRFKTAVPHDLLDQTFSSVQYHDITGMGPTWERDDGVWDEVA